MTDKITGKPARVIENKWTKELQESKAAVAPFPYQHLLTQQIRRVAAEMDRPDMMALYAGQNYAMASNFSASKIIPILVEQTAEAVEDLHQQLLSEHPPS